jgi:hypothetical protein
MFSEDMFGYSTIRSRPSGNNRGRSVEGERERSSDRGSCLLLALKRMFDLFT